MTRWPCAFIRICHLIGPAMLVVLALNTAPAEAQNTAQSASAQKLTTAQLEQLVAPIALYPDPLLSQVLMASTYPLEVVSAARWSQANPSVTGDALQTAMQQQTWDPSVKALTAVPQTLEMMSDKLDWTQQLGDAFLAQQSDVLDSVQRLRARADANGELKSTAEQKVTKSARGSGPQLSGSAPTTVYTIEPTSPDEYYVPVYDPSAAYGAWPYPDYQPFYWYPPGYAYGNVLSFAAGVFVGSAIWGNVNWFGNRVEVNPQRYNAFNRTNITNTNWAHNPTHRGGVPYRDTGVAQRFGNQGQNAAREAFRNQADIGRQELGKNGAANLKNAAGNKAGNGQAANNLKNNAGNKAADLKNKAGNKAGNGQAATNLKNNAGSKATDLKNAASNKKGGGNKEAGGKQKTQTKEAANRGSAKQQASRQPSGKQTASRNPGMQSRAQSVGGGGGGPRNIGAGGGGARGGGGRGGGRRSDLRLKHDIVLLGRLDNGIGFYRFSYNGSHKAYVGVLAQEVQAVMPQAVARDPDGYLRVFYDQLGLPFETYDRWIASGAPPPTLDRTRN